MAGKKRTASAFTLVELLVVVSIIALLIALLLPALKKAKEAANIVACSSNQRQLMVAFHAYLNDNHDYFQPAYPTYANSTYFIYINAYNGTHPVGGGVLIDYVGRSKVFFDPGVTHWRRGWGFNTMDHAEAMFARLHYSYWYFGSYAFGIIEQTGAASAISSSSTPVSPHPMYQWGPQTAVLAEVFNPGRFYVYHGLAGFNIAHLDGHVSWAKTKSFTQYQFSEANWQPWPTNLDSMHFWHEAAQK